MPVQPAVDEKLMIEPVLRSSIERLSTSREASIGAVMQIANTSFQFSSVCSQTYRSLPGMTALLSRMSTWPNSCHGAVDHGGDIVFVGHVGAHADGAIARSRGGFQHSFFAARDHQHLGAVLGKLLAHDRAGALAGAGDDGDFAGQPARIRAHALFSSSNHGPISARLMK